MKQRILFVDDDLPRAQFTIEALQTRFLVDVSQTASNAVLKLLRTPYRLVVTDILMPVGDTRPLPVNIAMRLSSESLYCRDAGLQLAALIHSTPPVCGTNSGIPVVIFSVLIGRLHENYEFLRGISCVRFVSKTQASYRDAVTIALEMTSGFEFPK